MGKKFKGTINKIISISFEKYFTVIALILISIYSIAITPKTFQNDTYYTIKIGEHITENRNRHERSIFMA